MKYCPNCQTRYTDDTLRFCLQDGAPLVAETDGAAPPTVQFGETETLVAPRAVEPLRFDLPEQTGASQSNEPPFASPANAAPPKKSKVLPLVLLTAFITLLLLGAGVAASWFYLKNNRADAGKNTAINVNAKTPETNVKSNANGKHSTAPTDLPKNESVANLSNSANAGPAVNLTPVPNIDREQIGQIKEEVAERVDGWRSLTESRDLNDYMSYYADTVDYYNKRGASAASIRADKQRAFGSFDAIEMSISNLTVTPDATGERATAVFDKEWVFDGEQKSSSGKVKSELQMRKINGEWLITSERDLKVYYIE